MPVRWPRRPAAVSEAVVADAEPDLSCAGELEQPLKALIGKVCRPPVGRSVARSVARSVLVELSISCGGVLCLGSSAAAGALGFPAPGYWILWASRLCSRLVFCHGRCMCVPVGTTPSSSCASLLVSRSLRLSRLGSRVGCAIAGGSTRLLAVITRVPPRLAVRCALFSVFVGVGRFSGDNKIGRLFGGASLWGFALGLRLRASPSGFAFGLRLRARPNPRLDSEPMGDARGRSRIPRKTPTANRGRSYGKTWPCGVPAHTRHQQHNHPSPPSNHRRPPPPPSPPPPPAETFTAALLNRKFNWALLFKKKKPHSRRPKVLAKN